MSRKKVVLLFKVKVTVKAFVIKKKKKRLSLLYLLNFFTHLQPNLFEWWNVVAFFQSSSSCAEYMDGADGSSTASVMSSVPTSPTHSKLSSGDSEQSTPKHHTPQRSKSNR